MAGINKFTQKAKRVLSLAQQEAEDEGIPIEYVLVQHKINN